MLFLPSPNYDPRPDNTPIDTLLLHYTGMVSASAALARLCDREAKVSAHFCIDEDGTVYQLVDPRYRAWHAGVSAWRGKQKINDNSIGIEIVNPGHEFGYRDFPEPQMEALRLLSKELLSTYPIPAHNVIAHSDVAPGRKQDPGERFDWAWLASHQIGIWPAIPQDSATNTEIVLKAGDEGERVLSLQKRLACYGYSLALSGVYDVATEQVVLAFKRHFCPKLLNPSWEMGADAILTDISIQVETFLKN